MNFVIYIAGPMSGIEEYNRPAFRDAEMKLLMLGENVTVLNPAVLPVSLPDKAYMPICLAMVEQADMLVLLPGWEDSEGAILEKNYALRQEKMVVHLDSFCFT